MKNRKAKDSYIRASNVPEIMFSLFKVKINNDHKWRRPMIRYGLIGLLIIMASFCCSSVHSSENVAMDLINYVNQDLHNLAAIEKRSLEQYAAVIGENYTTDEMIYKTLKKEVIPLYNRFYALLKSINPKTIEVKELHQIYVQAAGNIIEGFKIKMLGLEIKDDSIIVRGNRKIEKGRVGVDEWKEQLIELCDKNGVTQKD